MLRGGTTYLANISWCPNPFCERGCFFCAVRAAFSAVSQEQVHLPCVCPMSMAMESSDILGLRDELLEKVCAEREPLLGQSCGAPAAKAER